MPLLRRQPFAKEKPPPDLRPDEEVFFCKLTREVFRDYEKFFERIILCNSLVWSCAITGKAGLTYQEAEESEEKALKQLASFPTYLQKPILYLATKTQRSRLSDLNDDVFVFAKDRYFIGEMVDVLFGQSKKVCKVVGVLPHGATTPKSTVPKSPGSSQKSPIVLNGDSVEFSQPSSSGEMKTPDKKSSSNPEAFQYIVQEQGKTADHTVKFKMISRKKGLFTRDKCKLFLKQSCDNVDGAWRVKPSKMKKFKLETVTFEEVFSGPLPKFEFSEIKVKKVAPKKTEKEVSPQAAPKKPKEKSVEKVEKEGKSDSLPNLTMEEIKALREHERLQKEKDREEKLAQKLKEREEIKKKFEEEKEKRKLERVQEMEKKREERRVQAEMWREWSRQRDDMDCDDLQVLPEPKPVRCKIPADLFGDAVMVVEFLNGFSSLFDLRASFPKGFNLKVLFDALLESDAGGLMADLLLMMLTAIFSLQEEEEQEEAELNKQEKEQDVGPEENMGDMSLNQLIDAANAMSHVPILTQGTSLRKLPLDNFTLTEILRLHILASGAAGSQGDAKFRYQQRGGYMPIDDAGLDFKRREPEIVSKLAVENIYDLSPDDKLKLLKMVIDQFLTYAATRDILEDNGEKLRQLRIDLKQMQFGELKREREETATRSRAKMEEKQRERDLMEKRRVLKFKKRAQQLCKEEAEKSGKEPSEEDKNLATDIEKLEKDVAELEASMPSQEDRDRLREEEDDVEADRKADYVHKERDFLQNILNLQHGFCVTPLGRDRLYRRYWVFKTIPGLFVEDDEELVSPEALKPCKQNPGGSRFDINNPFTLPVGRPLVEGKVSSGKNEGDLKGEVSKTEQKDGSDKENDSLNASSINVSSADDNSVSNANAITGLSNTSNNTNTETAGPKLNGDAIVISDEDSRESKASLIEGFIETPATKQIMSSDRSKWSVFVTEEDVDALIASLNNRGYRESSLRQALMEQKITILDTISKVPTDLLLIPESDVEKLKEKADAKLTTTEVKMRGKSVTYTAQNDSAHEDLELNLREMVLDLEERIHVGTLGYLRVSDRNSWREALENGGYEPCTEDAPFKENKEENMDVAEEGDQSKEEQNLTIAIARDLAKAVIQIARGIEPKYMQPPLGDTEKAKQVKQKADASKKEHKKKKKEDDSDDEDPDMVARGSTGLGRPLIERWEDSCLTSTSLAQVFLHLSTLDKSIIWSKSILHTRCRICRKKSDPDKILLCDQCDRGHHMYCLKPQLKVVPEGEWFCPDCRPKELKSPRKGRRRAFSQEDSSEEEETQEEGSDGEEDMEAEDEASDEEGEEEEDTKAVKIKMNLGKMAGKEKAGKIKMSLGKMTGKGGKKKTSPKLTPSSSRQSSRKGSPRDSPVTVGGGKKRKQSSPLVLENPKMKKSGKSMSKLAQDFKTDDVKHYVSSSRGNSQVQQLKLLEDVVLGLMEDEEAWPFLRPVNKKDAPDYYEVIKKPMDFQTIKNKINKFMYSDPGELVSDVRQIFTNCVEYNRRNTQEFKAGVSMSKLFERRMKNLEESAAANGPTTGKRARTK
ncbi:bromodomain adjacent to zinc finger domain protein 1A-like [Dreissena polymorpha]|uniref:bromodomain adjacent to zinc finger domain protein 1A-like n=1 Tax=Dreissena polymorpha TaxID=45954 RepID=UPI002264B201|nr:bromodomain adjacent to zinc finger domain protein 1A-like [Dreissena polymorpha]XP_052275464.1 bromodomain adjacent to zinc finger domain protein 1A-like [Dreissena polymorpha]